MCDEPIEVEDPEGIAHPAPPTPPVGVVGFGHLGQYLVESITKHEDLELAWVWNRSPIHGKVEEKFILEDLADCAKNNPDVIVEVAHPDITR